MSSPKADMMDDAAPAQTLDDRRRRSSESPTSPPPPSRRRDRGDRDQSDRSPALPPPPPLPSSGPPPSRFDRDRERDRERDARRSPSPPPYRRRDRSPPRRSPPPAKRSRRDDGGYDRRRGSPRGGFGTGGRRYGYDYDDGYDRDGPGRRHGYGDEWPRHMNYPSDWHGRAGYGDGNAGVTGREGLMSYKQFIQELEDDVLPSEAEKRYEEYRSEYISTQKRAYFEAHKDEDWLKDKYHPTNLVTVIERRNEQARAAAKDFLLDMQSGSLDLGPGSTASSNNKSEQFGEPVSEDEMDNGGKRRRHGRGPSKGIDLHGDAPKAHPVSSEPRRIQVDIEQAQALVRKLDLEKGIEDNVLGGSDHEKSEGHKGSMGPIIIIRGLTTVKGLEGVELLDTLITYLWRIHGVDYYGMLETNERKGLRHVRADSKSSDGSSESAADWEKKVDSFWKQRLDGQDPLEVMAGKDKIEAASAEALDPLVRKIRDEKYGWKYGCGAKGCTKLFHAPEFVHKHLRLKHSDLMVELTAKVREDLFFQNYMNDPEAPGGKPVMRTSAPRDRVPRRRPLVHRLRDDRGSRREHDRAFREGDEDRYNMGITSPNLGKDDGSGDEYDGQGLHGAPPFSSDIPPPPPVLMPVPGAGPLGPFVPAPPEVAMQMLREQGAPPPFEANGGPRGRKRPGPQVGGPAPVFPVPQPFRQDPRRMRSYHDLDAPEDEVTVIDYRSL